MAFKVLRTWRPGPKIQQMVSGVNQRNRHWSGSLFPTISAYRDQLLSWQSAVHFNGFSASGQFDAAELIRYIKTKPQRRQPDQTYLKLLQMSGDVHSNPGPATKHPCPVCTRNVTSRGVSYKCTKILWMGAREMLWNLKCIPVSEEKWLYLRRLLGPTVPAIATTN